MHCVLISGHAKGSDFHVGHKFCTCREPVTHTWNAVCINGDWQLVDPHWGVRYTLMGSSLVPDVYSGGGSYLSVTKAVSSTVWDEREIGAKFVYECNEFYFLMEPQQAIYSHFPGQTEWQLLPIEKRLPLNQFENFPVLKSQFFACGLDLLDNFDGTCIVKNGLILKIV